jgi:hypothetical protein
MVHLGLQNDPLCDYHSRRNPRLVVHTGISFVARMGNTGSCSGGWVRLYLCFGGGVAVPLLSVAIL